MRNLTKIEITYKDERGAHHLVSFNDTSQAACKYQLDKIFVPATLVAYDEDGDRYAAGGVRPVKEEEKKRKNHKWFRWIELESPLKIGDNTKTEDVTENVDFMAELEKLSYHKAV